MTSMEDDVKQMMRQYQYLEHNRKVGRSALGDGALALGHAHRPWLTSASSPYCGVQEYAKDAANTIARQQKMIEMLKSDNEVGSGAPWTVFRVAAPV